MGCARSACCTRAIRSTEPEQYYRPRFAADRAAATPSASARGCSISGRGESADSGAAKCATNLTAIAWNQKGNDVVADGDFRGDIHAQHTVLSQPGGRACDCFCLECERRSDQRGGREGSGDHRIAGSAGAVEEVQEIRVGVGLHEMLSRIRNRPLQLSLVSAVTPMNYWPWLCTRLDRVAWLRRDRPQSARCWQSSFGTRRSLGEDCPRRGTLAAGPRARP